MTQKRRATDYNILIARAGQPKTLRLVGSVTAFTPDQARSRATKTIPAITAAALKSRAGSVTVYSIPATSMRPLSLRVKMTTTEETKDDDRAVVSK